MKYTIANSLTCYKRMIHDGTEFWLTADGDERTLDFHFVSLDLFQRLAVERLQVIEQAVGHGREIRDLLQCMPDGAKDCVGIMQIYLDACRPWPIHPSHNPVAMKKLHYLDVSNMSLERTAGVFEIYSGIMVSSEEHMHTRLCGESTWAQYDLRRKRIIHWSTDIESIILDIKRGQLPR